MQLDHIASAYPITYNLYAQQILTGATMGRKKMVEVAAEPTAAETPVVKTKAAAFREAVAKGIESPKAISEYVKTTYGMDMSPAMVSAYKGNEKSKDKKKPGRPKTTKEPANPAAMGTGVDNGILATLSALKGLVKAHGADGVKQMVDLLS